MTSLLEAAAERRRAESVADALDDERRSCACGRPLRSDNTSGRCRRCQRLHLAVRWCACGCGQQLSARAPDQLVAGPECVRLLVEFKRLALDIHGAMNVATGGDVPGAKRGGSIE
jgi:hypothetical protein